MPATRCCRRPCDGVRVWACAALAALACCNTASANDRPFLITSGAVIEDDNEGTWGLESWWQRVGPLRALTVAPEYNFNPFDSLQLLYTRLNDRNTRESNSNLEVEFKHVFNDIARDGHGWGLHLSLDTASPPGAGWRTERLAARVLYTLALSSPFSAGDAMLHLNAGIGKSRDQRHEWIGSAVFEHRLPWRTHAFVEVGREDRTSLLHTGLRHWVKRDRYAVDVGVQQLRGDGRRDSGVVIGFGWYDF